MFNLVNQHGNAYCVAKNEREKQELIKRGYKEVSEDKKGQPKDKAKTNRK